MAKRKEQTDDTAAADNAAAAVAEPKFAAWDSRPPQAIAAAEGGGFFPKPRTRRVTADPDIFPRLAPWEDAPPFWADIVDTLTFGQILSIPTESGTTYRAQQEIIAPWVIAWNAWAFNTETDAWEPAPPPAEYGPDIFESQTKDVTSFLVACFKFAAGTGLPKSGSRSESADSGNDATS